MSKRANSNAIERQLSLRAYGGEGWLVVFHWIYGNLGEKGDYPGDLLEVPEFMLIALKG